MSKRVDLTGQQMNEWKVLKYLGDGKYLCRCSCGKEKEVSGYALKKGTSKSCGHTTRVNTTRVNKDIKIGDTFGMLSVKEFIGGGKWKCECSCGDTVIALGKYLKTGRIVSCGKHKMEDLTGKTFGYWKVIKYAGNLRWTCQCKCGTVRDVLTQALKSGRSKSCGCGGRDVAANYREKMLAKYGDISINRANNPRQPWQIDVISNPDKFKSYITEFTVKHDKKPSILDLVKCLDTSFSSIAKTVHKFGLEDYISIYSNQSHVELEVYEFISKIYNGDIIQCDRKLIHPLELDIVLPDKKIAIEFNGDYWHSDLVIEDKKYHSNKTDKCEDIGYRLIHIFEYEWRHNKDKIKQYLSDLLNPTQVIYARNTSIVAVSNEIANRFLAENHLQGGAISSINLGLTYNNELVGLMTFGRPRFNSNYQYELIRLAYKGGISIIGGSEKLFKHFIEAYNPESIICYCNRTKFSGNVYVKLGMRLVEISSPGYVWVNSSNGDILPRYKTMKHKLLKDGLGDEQSSESDIMKGLGYYRIYDCGNSIYEWKRMEGVS